MVRDHFRRSGRRVRAPLLALQLPGRPLARVHHPSAALGIQDGARCPTARGGGRGGRSIRRLRPRGEAGKSGVHSGRHRDNLRAQHPAVAGRFTPSERWTEPSGQAMPEEIVLIYANRSEDDIPFRDELREIQTALPAFRVVHVLSHADRDWPGYRGHVNLDLLGRELPEAESWNYYLSGPPGFVQSMRELLLAWGYRTQLGEDRAFRRIRIEPRRASGQVRAYTVKTTWTTDSE